MSARPQTLDELRARTKRHGEAGCARCGKSTKGGAYFISILRELNVSRKGQMKEGEPQVKSKAGKTIISRNRTYCETCAAAVWAASQEWVEDFNREQG